MPLVDPTLAPSYGGPQQQAAQSIAALAARVAALERKRDLVITPIMDLAARNSVDGGHVEQEFTWYGGRLWITLGGRFYTTPAYTENTSGFITYPYINGYILGPAPIQGFGKANAGGVIGMASYTSTAGNPTYGTDPSNLVPGTNVLSFDIGSSFMSTVTMVALNGQIVEWPQL